MEEGAQLPQPCTPVHDWENSQDRGGHSFPGLASQGLSWKKWVCLPQSGILGLSQSSRGQLWNRGFGFPSLAL